MGLLSEGLKVCSDKKNERVCIYLTNALTGWEPPKGPKQQLLFRELEEERDAAEHVKRDVPILVILGVAIQWLRRSSVKEERTTSNAYRTTKRAPTPQEARLQDLCPFLRMAKRRIVEKPEGGCASSLTTPGLMDCRYRHA